MVNYTDEVHLDILVIMETRIHPTRVRRSFTLLGFDEFVYAVNRGFSGGIIVAWKSHKISIEVLEVQFQYIHMRVAYNAEDEWLFSAVYASPLEEVRRGLWQDLRNISTSLNRKWLVAGDFNDILSPYERKGGGNFDQRKATIFQENINHSRLMDLGSIGPKFTWKGPTFDGHDMLFKRLDRALCNLEWSGGHLNNVVKTIT